MSREASDKRQFLHLPALQIFHFAVITSPQRDDSPSWDPDPAALELAERDVAVEGEFVCDIIAGAGSIGKAVLKLTDAFFFFFLPVKFFL